MSVSLRDRVRDRLLSDMLGTLPEKGWKVLIVDDTTLKIISSACRLSDLMQKNITVVELLEKPRQPFPKMEAVYFIAPIESSAKIFYEDLQKKKYEAFHVYFSNIAPTSILKIIGASKNKTMIKTCVDLNMDFLALEANLFSFKDEDDIKKAFFSKQQDVYAEEIATKLLSFCLTVGELPFIRFDKNGKMAQLVSEKLQKHLDQYRNQNSKSKIAKAKPKALIFILDRSVDTVAPLVHEFTYQAMFQDLLRVEKGNIYTYEYVDGENKTVSKKVVIDDNDKIWVKYRHLHIVESRKAIKNELVDFRDNSGMNLSKQDRKNMKIEDMSSMMRKLPQYNTTLANYSLHYNAGQKLNDLFKKRHLVQIATEEQDMATGKDVNGNSPKYDIADILRKKDVPNSDKLRLIMLYVISKGGIKKDAQRKLVDVAKLSPQEEDALNNVLIVKPPKSFSFGSLMSNLFGQKNSSTSDEISYELSRFLPAVKDLSLKILKGTLSEKEYPYISKPSSEFKIESCKPNKKMEKKIEEEEIGGGGRLGGGGPSWNFLPKKKEETILNTKEIKKNDYKLYLFVVGGVTYSEVRTAYELEKEYNMEVIIGGTSVLRPVDFLDKLGKANSSGSKIESDELSV
eukprot:gene6730-10895_t